MKCDSSCRPPTGVRMAHCGTCHRTFSGVTGFDAHRVDGACVDPAKRGMRLSDDGLWRSAKAHPLGSRARA